MMRNPPSANWQRLRRVKLFAHVKPSPVGPAIVIVQWPSPPIPTPFNVEPFLAKIVVSILLAKYVI